jgi:pilus assembly protein CpaF
VVPIFQMSRLLKKADGSLQGQIEPTGEVPTFMEEIEDNQIPFPKAKFSRKAA